MRLLHASVGWLLEPLILYPGIKLRLTTLDVLWNVRLNKSLVWGLIVTTVGMLVGVSTCLVESDITT